MKNATALALVAVFSLQIAGTPVHALSEDEENVLGAIAILGIAALAHNESNYHENYRPSNSQAMAKFERGYRDGLHNEPYDSRHSSYDYGQGYDAGQKERQNRLAHKTRNVQGTKVPVVALRSCRAEVVSSLGVNQHNVSLINAGQEGADNYYVEFAAGHRHVVCGTNSRGDIFNLRDGRL